MLAPLASIVAAHSDPRVPARRANAFAHAFPHAFSL